MQPLNVIFKGIDLEKILQYARKNKLIKDIKKVRSKINEKIDKFISKKSKHIKKWHIWENDILLSDKLVIDFILYRLKNVFVIVDFVIQIKFSYSEESESIIISLGLFLETMLYQVDEIKQITESDLLSCTVFGKIFDMQEFSYSPYVAYERSILADGTKVCFEKE